jgi:hypothetical protein
MAAENNEVNQETISSILKTATTPASQAASNPTLHERVLARARKLTGI